MWHRRLRLAQQLAQKTFSEQAKAILKGAFHQACAGGRDAPARVR